MFEYAVSCGEGTLLDYGFAHSTYLNTIIADWDALFAFPCEDGATILMARDEDEWQIRYSPASPDCLTGQ